MLSQDNFIFNREKPVHIHSDSFTFENKTILLFSVKNESLSLRDRSGKIPSPPIRLIPNALIAYLCQQYPAKEVNTIFSGLGRIIKILI